MSHSVGRGIYCIVKSIKIYKTVVANVSLFIRLKMYIVFYLLQSKTRALYTVWYKLPRIDTNMVSKLKKNINSRIEKELNNLFKEKPR